MASPNSSLQLSCTGWTAYGTNEMYFTLTPPSASAEIDFHNAQNDRFNVFVKQWNLHHFWLPWKFDSTGRGYVTIDTIENAYNFGASTLTCFDKSYTGQLLWSIGKQDIIVNTNYQWMQDFLFYVLLLPFFFFFLVWFIAKRIIKLFF